MTVQMNCQQLNVKQALKQSGLHLRSFFAYALCGLRAKARTNMEG
jgi:hypothetical protein